MCGAVLGWAVGGEVGVGIMVGGEVGVGIRVVFVFPSHLKIHTKTITVVYIYIGLVIFN